MQRTDPIDNVVWLNARELVANDYNPNVVFTPELRLLEFSILQTGWVQPILVALDKTIIDGFHRWRLALESQALLERYGRRCPCVVLQLHRAEAIALTVRINRAKGSHVALRMASLVKELVYKHAWDTKRVQQEIGATKDEVELLLRDGVFAERDIKNYRYSKAWYPAVGGKGDGK